MIPHDVLAALPALLIRALLESVVVGGLLAGAVWLTVGRLAPMRANARHTVWSLALAAIAMLPLVSIGSSLAHITHASAPAPEFHAAGSSTSGTAPAVRLGTTGILRAEHVTHARIDLPRVTIPESLALTALVIWAAGAAIGFALLAASVVRVSGLKRRSSPLEGSLADELPWLTAPHDREIYLRLSYEIETPVAIGFGRPVILIPTELATTDGLGAIESLVMHEHAHLRRYDDYTNLAQRIVERLFWFNPIVWIVGKRIALEREIASDDCVVAQTGHPQDYAESLWRLAKEMRMPEHAIVAPGALLTRKQITVRIEQLLDANRDLRPRLSPAAFVTLGLGSALAMLTMTVSAPAIELPAPLVATSTTTSDGRGHATTTERRFVIGDANPEIALQELPALPTPSAAPRVRSAPLTDAQRQALQHINDVDRANRAASGAPSIERHILLIEDKRTGLKHEREASASAAAAEAAAEALASTLPAPPERPAVPVPPRTIRVRPLIPHISVNRPHFDAFRLLDLQSRIAAGEPVTPELIAQCMGCNLRGRDLHGIDLSNRTLTGTNLRGANLTGANLSGATLNGVDLRGALLDDADLRNAHFMGSSLVGVSLNNAKTTGITLTGSPLGHLHLPLGERGRDLLHDCSGCDLRGMDLRRADLHGLHFTGADMRGVDLTGADLHGTIVTGTDLRGAKLTGADLRNAEFMGCDLRDADLHGANVTGTSFTGSDISSSAP